MGPVASDASVFILAGGKSSRMGVDKAFVELNGKTLLQTALEKAGSVAEGVRIVGEAARFSAYGPVVEDRFQDCGPLAGIHAALRGSSSALNLMLAVDVPFASAALLQYLLRRARESSAIVVIPRVGGGWQPLCAVYRRDFGDVAEHALKARKYKIDALFDQVTIEAVGEQELAAAGFSSNMFQNVNTKEELEEAARMLKQH